MAKHWRKRMEEAAAAMPAPFTCGALTVAAVDAHAIDIKIAPIEIEPAGISIDLDDAQRLADWLRKSYGIVGRAK